MDINLNKEQNKVLNQLQNGITDPLLIHGLGKRYNLFPAVNNISFTVENEEIFGFLGTNGAGKTTTLKMLTVKLL